MKTRARWHNGVLVFYEQTSLETIHAQAPVWFKDDFTGAHLQKFTTAENTTSFWRTVETNLDTAIGLSDDVVNGVAAIIVDSADIAKVGCLHFGDNLCLSMKQGLVFEARLAFSPLPTTGTETVQAVFGLASAHNTTLDSIATNAWFRVESGAQTALLWETDDGNTDDDDNSAGITLVPATNNIYRIDCTDLVNGVKFYVDGVLVGTSADMNTNLSAGEAKVQPYFNVSKAKSSANTGACTMLIDYVCWWQARS
jgi:hypothetical protein